jgi:hypothetical protein
MTRKRRLLAGVVALAGLCTSAPVLAAAPPSTQQIDPIFNRALLPSERKLAITALMRPINGTVSMEMMLDLERARMRTGHFAIVRGRGLDQWVHPDNPTLGQRPGDVWKLDQQVENLSGTAYYRFRVRFRWTGANGRTLGTSAATGPVCYEPELRPDLLVRSLTVKPITSQPSEDRYVAVIANRGRTSAGPFDVELIVPSKPSQTVTVNGLGPRSSVHAMFTTPACNPGSQLTVIADPNAAVLDYERANNTLVTQCPSPTQGRRYTS